MPANGVRIRSANHEGRTGTTARPQTVEALVREAGVLLAERGTSMSRSKVSSLARAYLRSPVGHSFAQYIAANANDLRRVISYRDPTGETASTNVDRERKSVA